MELWMRSQDKMDIMKIESIHIEEIPSSKEVTILGYASGNKFTRLGYYKSKERALEVLDEIQEILKPRTIIKFENRPRYLEDGTISDVLAPKECLDYSKQLINYVYEMPEE